MGSVLNPKPIRLAHPAFRTIVSKVFEAAAISRLFLPVEISVES
jgi:hypothetical protein